LRYTDLNPVRAALCFHAWHWRTGAPLGSLEFVRQLEVSAGRRLEVFARGMLKG
jgi:hypothetical protein